MKTGKTNKIDPDEVAHVQPNNQQLHCLSSVLVISQYVIAGMEHFYFNYADVFFSVSFI